MPRLRFTVRRLMLIVAIAAVAIAGIEMKRRRDERIKLAKYYSSCADAASSFRAMCVDMVAAKRAFAEGHRWRGNHLFIPSSERHLPLPREGFGIQRRYEEEAERMEAEADEQERQAEVRGREVVHYRSLKAKYERAARYPWLSIEPDPPEPK